MVSFVFEYIFALFCRILLSPTFRDVTITSVGECLFIHTSEVMTCTYTCVCCFVHTGCVPVFHVTQNSGNLKRSARRNFCTYLARTRSVILLYNVRFCVCVRDLARSIIVAFEFHKRLN